MPSNSTLSVPWEIIDRIFDTLAPSWILEQVQTDESSSSPDGQVFPTAALINCRCVSRSFRDHANARLFYRIAFRVEVNVSKSLRRLQRMLELGVADGVFRHVQVLEYVQEHATRFDEELHRALGGVLRRLLDDGGSSTRIQGPGGDEATTRGNPFGQRRRQMKSIHLRFGSAIRPSRAWTDFDEEFHRALKEISRSSLTRQLTLKYLAALPPEFFNDITIPILHLHSVHPNFADILQSRKRAFRIGQASQIQGSAEEASTRPLPAFVELCTDLMVPVDLTNRQIKKLIVMDQLWPEGFRLIYTKADALEHLEVKVQIHDLHQRSFAFSRGLSPMPIFPHLKSITAVAASSQVFSNTEGVGYDIHEVAVFQGPLIIERLLVPENVPCLEKVTFEVPFNIQAHMARSQIRFSLVWSEFDEALCALMERYQRAGGSLKRPEFWMVFRVHIVYMRAQGPVAGSVEAERAYWEASQWPSRGAGIEEAFPQIFRRFSGWIKFANEYKISPISPGD